MSAQPERYISIEEYFQLEESGEGKHEYYQGAIYAMTGASTRHNLIAVNITSALHPQLRGKSCIVYPSDLRLKIESSGLYTYPDAMVICGNTRYADKRKDMVTNPSVIFEVLSPSTEDYDRGKKFAQYRTVETLQEYLVFSQESVHVEHYTRQQEHQWLLVEYTQIDQEIHLKSIDCTLTLAAVYEKVELEEE